MAQSFNIYFEESIKKNWELPALSDFKGVAYHYKDIARKIEKISNCFLLKDNKNSNYIIPLLTIFKNY